MKCVGEKKAVLAGSVSISGKGETWYQRISDREDVGSRGRGMEEACRRLYRDIGIKM